jgi:hypothetical protein
LRPLSHDDLLAVGELATEHIEVHGRPASVTIIVEPKADGSLRVVVQGFMRARLLPFISSVALDGFYKRPNGAVEPMPDKEFYEFD